MRNFGKSFLLLGAVAVALCLVASGCDKPTAEMKRAEAAIRDAKNAGAAEYAVAELASAEKELSQGKDEMDAWSYKKARESFEEAYRLALKAKEIALAYQPPVPDVVERPVYVAPPPPPSMDAHTVARGDCLWYIAEGREAYSDPFQWPLIYDANRDEIDRTAHRYGHYNREQDWIYPDQEFDVPRDASTEDVKNARRRAGAPDAYSPGY